MNWEILDESIIIYIIIDTYQWLIFQLPSKTKLFCIHIVMLYLDIFEFCKKLCIFNRKKKVVSWIRTSSVLAGLFQNILRLENDLKIIWSKYRQQNYLSRRIPSFYQQWKTLDVKFSQPLDESVGACVGTPNPKHDLAVDRGWGWKSLNNAFMSKSSFLLNLVSSILKLFSTF